MVRTKWLSVFSVFLALFFSASSYAQKTYRCGSVYQDRPCDDAQNSKEVRYLGGGASAPAGQGVDQQCKQRGIDSQKIVWARQSGVLAEKLIAEVASKGLDSSRANEERNLIAAVYQKPRGSAVEVAAAIEADCVDARKQAALSAALIAEGLKLQGKDPLAAGTPTPNTGAQTAARTSSESSSATNAAANKTTLCSSLSAKVDAVKSNQLAGGSMPDMERLNRLRTSAEADKSRAGC